MNSSWLISNPCEAGGPGNGGTGIAGSYFLDFGVGTSIGSYFVIGAGLVLGLVARSAGVGSVAAGGAVSGCMTAGTDSGSNACGSSLGWLLGAVVIQALSIESSRMLSIPPQYLILAVVVNDRSR